MFKFLHVPIDIDECRQDNGGCLQVCNNILGSYNCTCHHGYYLEGDEKTCNGKTELKSYSRTTVYTGMLKYSLGKHHGPNQKWQALYMAMPCVE